MYIRHCLRMLRRGAARPDVAGARNTRRFTDDQSLKRRHIFIFAVSLYDPEEPLRRTRMKTKHTA